MSNKKENTCVLCNKKKGQDYSLVMFKVYPAKKRGQPAQMEGPAYSDVPICPNCLRRQKRFTALYAIAIFVLLAIILIRYPTPLTTQYALIWASYVLVIGVGIYISVHSLIPVNHHDGEILAYRIRRRKLSKEGWNRITTASDYKKMQARARQNAEKKAGPTAKDTSSKQD
jgi:hypothetical protein